MDRIGQEILRHWSLLVAKKLGRPESEILQKGLSASDFNAAMNVTVSVPGELECTFSNAFSVIDTELARVAVFTEHSGYHQFYLSGAKVSEVTSVEYWDSDYNG